MKKSVSLLLALILCLASYTAMAVVITDGRDRTNAVRGEFSESYQQRIVSESAELTVYASPGGRNGENTSKVLGTLSAGTFVELIKFDITGKWVRVLYNERENGGWVKLDSLEKVS